MFIKSRRLTREMRRELVRCLRTPAFLAMFSNDSETVSNIQSALKSMTVMEPDLIVPPVLERAVPSLEALVEVCNPLVDMLSGAETGLKTQRTLAVIKALGAVALGIVARDVYYGGAKHLVQILELLLPGIDLVRGTLAARDRMLMDCLPKERSSQNCMCIYVTLASL